MNDGELEPGTSVKVHDVDAAEKRYDAASREQREAAWLELWHARDFTWRGRSAKAALQTEMVEVPASFPDGREAEGEFKTVSLKDYWRWSVGLSGEERLLTDEEMRGAGLLVEVDGETYHLIHAPDMGLKGGEHGRPLQILTAIIAARAKRVPQEMAVADGRQIYTLALQLPGGWLPADLLRHTGNDTAIDMSNARVSDIDASGVKVGHLNCLRSLFTGKANFESATFSGGARFDRTTFSGAASFYRATFVDILTFHRAAFVGRASFLNTTFSSAAEFGGAVFHGEADFWDASFGGKTNFEMTSFNYKVRFQGVSFKGEANFNRVTFSVSAVFKGAAFSGDAGLGTTKSGRAATFLNATFKGDAEFEGATFTADADFVEATFSKRVNFSGVKFGGQAVFGRFKDGTGTNFVGEASFSGAAFVKMAIFLNATFSGEANFKHATFSGGARFGGTTFSGAAHFERANFARIVHFNRAKFNHMARFGATTFNGAAEFKGTTFTANADFVKATFSGGADFWGTIFEDTLTFEDGTFERVVSFKDVNWPKTNNPNAFLGARFKDRVDFKSDSAPSISAFNEAHFEIPPSFRDLTQRELDEVFSGSISQTKEPIRLAKKEMSEAKRKKKEYKGLTPDQLLAALEGGFRTLKKVAEEKGNFLLSQTYYRFEVKTRVKRPKIPFWEQVAAKFYGLSSDYGNSIARPFVSLAVVLAGFAAVYLALAIEVNFVEWNDTSALQSGLFQSIQFSLTNIFRPLSALSPDALGEAEVSRLSVKLLRHSGEAFGLIVTAISIVQSLTGIVLAFLFGLAVRRRFQIS